MLKIRQAKKTDDFEVIGLLLYLTDPYIYPYWFNNDENYGKKELAKLCFVKNSVYYYKHIIVAEFDGKIVGAICAYDDKEDLSYDYKKDIENNPRTKKVFDGYLSGLVKEQESGFVNISNICVFEPYRRHGIGRHLLKHVLNKHRFQGFTFQIEVVKDNVPAIALYKSLGFELVKEYDGFCMTKKLPCYLIRRYNKK